VIAAPAAAAPVVEPAPEAPVAPVEAVQGNEATANAGSLLESSKRKLDAGDAVGAEALARSALSAAPDDHHAMEALARALLNQGRAQDALTYIEVIVKKRAKRAAYRILEGDAKSLLGDHQGAQQAWRTAQKLEPGNHDLVQRLGVD
jgi:predicted negative regulator of RcsB-dependent stress response